MNLKLFSKYFNRSSMQWMRNFLTVLFLLSGSADANFIELYNFTTNGGIAFTGNTLGLNGGDDNNLPGTSGTIKAFITLDNSLNVAGWPTSPTAGTTLDYTLNGSTAVLDLPSGTNKILHAELIWGGTCNWQTNPVTLPIDTVEIARIIFTTPDGMPHYLTTNSSGTPGGTGTTSFQTNTAEDGIAGSYYTTSYNVTDILTALTSPTGTYSVQAVPGTVLSSINNLNCCGWTLAVAYENDQMLTSNISLYAANDHSKPPPDAVLVTGFQAPMMGAITSAKIFFSCLEGDAALTQDNFLVGSSATLSAPGCTGVGCTGPLNDALIGANNPSNNFFASQINTILNVTTDPLNNKLILSGLIPTHSSILDTRGSFGTLNSIPNPGKGVTGARQGYDIAVCDITDKITNGQTGIWVQPTTDEDDYVLNALGLLIQVSAPIINSVKTADVSTVHAIGDQINFTCTFTNVGDAEATDLLFTDLLPTGLQYVAGSYKVNGMKPVTDPGTPGGFSMVPVGILNPNPPSTDQLIITFTAEVTAINPPTSFTNQASVQYNFFNQPSPGPTNYNSITTPVTINYSPPAITPTIQANPDYATVKMSNKPIVAIPNVLANDNLGGFVPTTSDVKISLVTGNPRLKLDTSTGSVTVKAKTVPGIYQLVYMICQKSAPSNCSTTTATVVVTPMPIVANPDTATICPSPSTTIAIANVLANDSLDGFTPTTKDVTITLVKGNNHLFLNTLTGRVTVKGGTPPGIYELVYKICQKAVPDNCSSTTVTINVGTSCCNQCQPKLVCRKICH